MQIEEPGAVERDRAQPLEQGGIPGGKIEASNGVVVLEGMGVPFRRVVDDARLARWIVAEQHLGRRQQLDAAGAGEQGEVELAAVDEALGEPVAAMAALPAPEQGRQLPGIGHDRVVIDPDRGMLPHRLDDVGAAEGGCLGRRGPGRRRDPGGRHHLLGQGLVRGQEDRLGGRAGVAEADGVEQRRGQVNEPALAVDRFDEIDGEGRLQRDEAGAGGGEVEGQRHRDRGVAEPGQRPADPLGLDQDILLVRSGVGGDGAMQDRDLAAASFEANEHGRRYSAAALWPTPARRSAEPAMRPISVP